MEPPFYAPLVSLSLRRALLVRVERQQAKVGGREDITPLALWVTLIFRPEEGTWKVVHRHADPIATRRPAESVIVKDGGAELEVRL